MSGVSRDHDALAEPDAAITVPSESRSIRPGLPGGECESGAQVPENALETELSIDTKANGSTERPTTRWMRKAGDIRMISLDAPLCGRTLVTGDAPGSVLHQCSGTLSRPLGGRRGRTEQSIQHGAPFAR
jgi:hypothetical protein